VPSGLLAAVALSVIKILVEGQLLSFHGFPISFSILVPDYWEYLYQVLPFARKNLT